MDCYKLRIISLFYSIFYLYKIIFFLLLFVLSYIIKIYILNIARAIKKMSVHGIRDFILKTIINEFDFLRETVII